MWTHFWDMHSGGDLKEPQQHIFIEADEDEAKRIFYARFGHNPERVTCTCCGGDYSIRSNKSLAQLTGHHRNCRNLETTRDPVTGLYRNNDPILRAHYYLEDGEDPPPGYAVDTRFRRYDNWQSLDDYLKREDVLVIRAEDIKPEWRSADVPEQGYVWVD
jgi:hypothetical protein